MPKVLVFGAALGKASASTAERGRRGASWAAAPHAVWTCGGLPLECVADCKSRAWYSPRWLASRRRPSGAGLQAPAGQLFVSWDRFRQQFGILQDGLSFALQRGMFQQSVPSAGSYACEALGFRRLRGPTIQACEQEAGSVVQLWRRLPRVCSGVAGAVVLRELGVLSPETVWLWARCGFGMCWWGRWRARCIGQ